MARTYKRDALGRFAGGGGGGGRPKARSVSKGANRLTRDNAGRITSVGGTGATARGGRLRTAGGNLRAAQTARIKGGGVNTIAKGGRGVSGPVARSLRAAQASRRAMKPTSKPESLTGKPIGGNSARKPLSRRGGNGVLAGWQRDVVLKGPGVRVQYSKARNRGGPSVLQKEDFTGIGGRRMRSYRLTGLKEARAEIGVRTRPHGLGPKKQPAMQRLRGYSKKMTRRQAWDVANGRG
jgi:hypothetical protein